MLDFKQQLLALPAAVRCRVCHASLTPWEARTVTTAVECFSCGSARVLRGVEDSLFALIRYQQNTLKTADTLDALDGLDDDDDD